MAGLNRVVLVGRLVRDPEMRKTNSGAAVTSFTIAVDKPGRVENNQDRAASFIACTCWNKTAENVAKFCKKGYLVGVDGRLNQRSYEDKMGQKRSVTEVIAESVQFLSEKNRGNDDTPVSSSPYSNDDSVRDYSDSHEGIDGTDDDMPF